MRTGFVLGKFAPLHKGHQLLIETALTENDRVVVMIYHAPEVTGIPLPVRAAWIRHIYPQIEVIEAWDGPRETGNSPDITQKHDAYILRMLAGRKIDAFYSSEFYGAHVSRALGAKDRRIDPERTRIPTSGTAIRADSYGQRHFLHARVYWDIITKVVFLGAPSTGKTTLARALAEDYNTVWMPEYGREYWEAKQVNRRLSLEELLEIAQGHREREESMVLEARQHLFIDTDASTTAMFSRYYHQQVHPELALLAEESRHRYDIFFLCASDMPYDDTWDRSGDAQRQVFQAQIEADLQARAIPYIRLHGDLAIRRQQVRKVLEGFAPHQSLANHLWRKCQRFS